MVHQKQILKDWPPKLAVCVGAVVLKENRALFIRQAVGHSLEGQWSIPWGVVDPGESPESAALRETEEESGIRARVEGLLGFQNLRQEGWIALVFLCQHLHGKPRPDGGVETDAAAYFSLEEMEEFTEPFEPWCQWLIQRVLKGEYHILPIELENPYYPHLAFF